MRKRLFTATARVEEVRQCPIGVIGRRLESDPQNAQGISRGWINNVTHKRKVNAMLNTIRQFVKEEEGASAAEYALLLALVSLFIVGAVTVLGNNIATAINAAAGVIAS